MSLQEIGVPVVENILEHHGVRGMKWGVRTRGQVSVGNKVKGKFDQTLKSKPASADAKEFSKLRGKKSHELSNEELRKVAQRGELLTKFHRMNPSSITKGRAAIASLVALGGTGITIYNMVNSKAGQHAISVGKSAISSSLAKEAAKKAAKKSGQLAFPGM